MNEFSGKELQLEFSQSYRDFDLSNLDILSLDLSGPGFCHGDKNPNHLSDIIEKYSPLPGFKNNLINTIINYFLTPYINNKIIIAESQSTLRAKISGIPVVETLLDIIQLKGVFNYIYDVFRLNEEEKLCPPAFFFKKAEIILEIFESVNPCDLSGRSCEKEQLRIIPYDEKKITVFRGSNSVEYRANVDGYIAMDRDIITICEAVRISEDMSEVNAYILPQLESGEILINHIFDWYNDFSLRNPSSPIQSIPEKNTLSLPGKIVYKICLVKGEKPVYGKNAEIIRVAEIEKAEIDENGIIDYKEIKNYIAVKENDVLFIKYLMIEGHDGIDIYGKKIKVPVFHDQLININENIIAEESDGKITYKAKTDGIYKYNNTDAAVDEVMIIESNVDYQTGNVYFAKSVVVKGDITTGFTVKSDKDIYVEGSAEDGSIINCKGNLEVSGGIIGSRTRINVEGNITAGHVQDAVIYCQGKTVIIKTLIGGMIFSKKSLTVSGRNIHRQGRTALYGGRYYSMSKIKIHSAGNS
ncbi:MAG TPA: hypothetical protein DCY00_05200, partial [Actinobacteria bacterium]|nr:hypothetical protein [Actinomycetota bacterium]